MLVTINTDASFHPQLKFGAYAFWAISNDFKITKSGVFRRKCITPDDAEAKCIINALKVVLLSHSGITKIIINTDSLNATAILKNNKKHIRQYVRLKQQQIKELQESYKLILQQNKNKVNIEFRHVKAHTGINDARSYVNEWCDSEAKKRLRTKVGYVKFN